VSAIGLRKEQYGTHSLRRTKASIIYKATGNLRAVQILLGHTKIENTVRYLGVDVEDVLSWLKRQKSTTSGPPPGEAAAAMRPKAVIDVGSVPAGRARNRLKQRSQLFARVSSDFGGLGRPPRSP
jgi:hypothetical protein